MFFFHFDSEHHQNNFKCCCWWRPCRTHGVSNVHNHFRVRGKIKLLRILIIGFSNNRHPTGNSNPSISSPNQWIHSQVPRSPAMTIQNLRLHYWHIWNGRRFRHLLDGRRWRNQIWNANIYSVVVYVCNPWRRRSGDPVPRSDPSCVTSWVC